MPPVVISRANWKLALDSRDLDGKLIASRKEINAAKRAMNDLATPLERYEAEMEKAAGLLKFGTEGQELYNRAVERAKQRLDDARAAEEGRLTSTQKMTLRNQRLAKAEQMLSQERASAQRIIESQKTASQKLADETHRLDKLVKRGLLTTEQRNVQLKKTRGELKEEARALRENSKLYKASMLARNTLIGAIVASSAATAASVRRDLAQIDKLAKASDKLKIKTEELTGLQFAIGKSSGIGDDRVIKLLEKMTLRTGQAAAGTGEAKKSIEELGLEAKELVKLSPDKMFLRYADAIAKVTSGTDKLRLATKIFDDEQAGVFTTLEKGSSVIQAMQQRAKDLGLTLTRLDARSIEATNDAMLEFNSAFAGFSREFTVSIAPSLTSLIHEMTDLLGDLRGSGSTSERTPGTATGNFGTAIDFGTAAVMTLFEDPTKDWAFNRFFNNLSEIENDRARRISDRAFEANKARSKAQGDQEQKEVSRLFGVFGRTAKGVAMDFGSTLSKTVNEKLTFAQGKKDAFLFEQAFNRDLEAARERRKGSEAVAETITKRIGSESSVVAGSVEAFRLINQRQQKVVSKELKVAEKNKSANERTASLMEQFLGSFDLAETSL